MANNLPAKTSFQSGQPLGASELNALASAINQSAAAKATAAGDTFYATGANALAKLAAGSAGQVLKMNSGATAPEWGSGLDITTVTQSSNYTITSSYATVTGLTASITTESDNQTVIMLCVGGLQIPSNAANVLFKGTINSVADAAPLYLNNSTGSTMIWPFTYLHYETVATAGTFDVYLEVSRSAGGGTVIDARMLVFVV